jgi:hypothetical protein
MLPFEDNHVLGCEWVENELRRFSFSLAIPSELRNLSLRRSTVDEIIAALELFPNVGGFALPRQGAPGLLEAKFDSRRMLSYLRLLKEQRLNPQDLLLPPPDLALESIPENLRSLLWGRYSDEQLQARIARFFDFFQQSYRWVIEHHFPTLMEQMYLYRIGPLRFHATIFKDRNERIAALPWEPRASVRVSWEPVPEGDDYSTSTQMIFDDPENLFADVSHVFRRIESQLAHLGRMSILVSRQLRLGGYGHIEDYFMPDALNREVYRQLEQDLVRDLMGDTMSRIA